MWPHTFRVRQHTCLQAKVHAFANDGHLGRGGHCRVHGFGGVHSPAVAGIRYKRTAIKPTQLPKWQPKPVAFSYLLWLIVHLPQQIFTVGAWVYTIKTMPHNPAAVYNCHGMC